VVTISVHPLTLSLPQYRFRINHTNRIVVIKCSNYCRPPKRTGHMSSLYKFGMKQPWRNPVFRISLPPEGIKKTDSGRSMSSQAV